MNENSMAPRPDDTIIPPGVGWSLLYDRAQEPARRVGILEVAEADGDAVLAMIADLNDPLSLWALVRAGVPFRVLTARSNPDVAQYLAHGDMRIEALKEREERKRRM